MKDPKDPDWVATVFLAAVVALHPKMLLCRLLLLLLLSLISQQRHSLSEHTNSGQAQAFPASPSSSSLLPTQTFLKNDQRWKRSTFSTLSPTYTRPYQHWFGDNNVTKTYSFEQVYRNEGVEPPLQASSWVWRALSAFHRRAIPLLHTFDKYKPQNSALCLVCLWWKALVGLSQHTSTRRTTSSHLLPYYLLPRSTRWMLKLCRPLFPRFHHANIELRTVVIDRLIAQVVNQTQQQQDETPPKIRLIVLGAGYDVRSIRLRQSGVIDEALELDLPSVITCKQRLLQQRLVRECPDCADFLPRVRTADLNECAQLEQILTEELSSGQSDNSNTTNIFLSEGVMVHLKPGAGHALLDTCRKVVREQLSYLIFSDHLDHVENRSVDMAREELSSIGWELQEFLSTPTKTAHIGLAAMC